jgi:nicotinamidase-related amidase
VAGGALTFPIRHFQFLGIYGPGVPYPPEAYEGLIETELEVSPEHAGLVAAHCWNLADPDGPYPFLPGVRGSTSAQWARRAVTICEQRRQPLMCACREAGIAVFHLASKAYADRYPQYRVTADPEQQAPPPAPLVPEGSRIPARCVAPEAQIDHTAKATGPHFPGAPWRTMPEKFDVARVVRPKPEDEVVTDGWQLHGLCHRRGIHTLLYAGFVADVCLMQVSGAIEEMKNRYGYRVVALRDCTTAFEYDDTLRAGPEDDGWMTYVALRRIELAYGYTSDSVSVRRACERYVAAREPRREPAMAGAQPRT